MDDLHIPYTHDDYTIGWVCALPKEQSAAIFMLEERHEDLPNPTGDHNTYILGSIGKHKIVIAGLPKGRIGNNSAATVATRMVSTFTNIRIGLMVGIGGGIPQKTRLGDVVISCPINTEPGVIQWDMGKAEAGGQFVRTGSLAPPPTALLTALTKFEADQITTRTNVLSYLKNLENIPNMPKSFLKSDSLQDILYQSSYKHVKGDDDSGYSYTEGDDCRLCDKSKVIHRSERQNGMMIHCGLIASGNQVVKDAILRDKLYDKFNNNILCIEMEAAGLMNDFPCLVIRGICDYADSHKSEKWQDYAAATAAACAKALLMVVPTSEVDKLQRVQLTISPGLIEGAKKYFSFWPSYKKDAADSTVTTSPEETKDKNDFQLLQTQPPETAKSSDTSPDAKSRETNPDEKPREIIPAEMPTQATPAEMPTQTSPDNKTPMQQTFEAWLREAPSSLATILQQGNTEAVLRNIFTSLSQPPVPQEGGNPPQGYTAYGNNDYRDDGRGLGVRNVNYAQMPPSGQRNGWGNAPSQPSMPYPEDYNGYPSEQNYNYGNDGRHSNTVPYPTRTPSPFHAEFRGYGHQRSQTCSNDGTAPAPQNQSRPVAYPSRTPSPLQTGYRNHISEQNQNYGNHWQFNNAPAPVPAPPSLHISTKYPSSGYDTVGNGARDDHYPLSPPQSPVSRTYPGQGNTMRRVSEPQNNGGRNPPVHDPYAEDNGMFGYKYGNQPYVSEPIPISPTEGQRSATPSQGRQPLLLAKNNSVPGPGTRNNNTGLAPRRSQFSEPSPINPIKGQRSATPIPSQRPPLPAKSKLRDVATKDNNHGFRRPCISELNTTNSNERRRSTTPSQGRQLSFMNLDNNSVKSLGTGAPLPPSPNQPNPSHVIRRVQSQRFASNSKIPMPVWQDQNTTPPSQLQQGARLSSRYSPK